MKATTTMVSRRWNQRGDVNVIVVGAGKLAERLVMRLNRTPGITVVGRVDDDPPEPSDVIGRLEDLRRLCAEHSVGRVLVAFSRTPAHIQLAHLRSLEQQTSVSIVPRLYEMLAPGATTDDFLGIPVIHVAAGRSGRAALTLKRLLDVTMAALILILLAPVLLAVAIAIKLTSPGPVFFRQARTGLNSAPFSIFKFRTMSVDAEERREELLAFSEVDGPIFKMRADPRVFPVGAFLRRTSLDELPQLLNVIRGDMSLVGPRPLPVAEAAQIPESGGISRTAVRPGITGLWQVCGRSSLNGDDLEQLDATYASSWSLAWDLKILLRTPRCVIVRSGAY